MAKDAPLPLKHTLRDVRRWNAKRAARRLRPFYMAWLSGAFALVPVMRCAGDGPVSERGVSTLISGVEARYNRARALSLAFSEEYSAFGRRRPAETGTLTLLKPGRMRWQYTEPPGKLFVADGHDVFLYTPSDHRVEKSPLKASDDLRAPLAFLLGKLDVRRQFGAVGAQTDAAGTWLVAEARNDRAPYRRVRLLLAPDYAIRQLLVEGRDESLLHFWFRNEVMNPPATKSQFQFTIPPGAEVVDALTVSEGERSP